MDWDEIIIWIGNTSDQESKTHLRCAICGWNSTEVFGTYSIQDLQNYSLHDCKEDSNA